MLVTIIAFRFEMLRKRRDIVHTMCQTATNIYKYKDDRFVTFVIVNILKKSTFWSDLM